MKRRDGANSEVIVRKYGLLEPSDWDDDVLKQLRLENEFWNRLVEMDLEHRGMYRGIMEMDSEYGEMQKKIEELRVRFHSLRKEKNSLRKHKLDTEMIESSIVSTKEEMGILIERMKKEKDRVKKAMKSELEALEVIRKSDVKQARRTIADEGLWWGNYNTVIDGFEVARVRAMKEGKELNFHRFDGSGRLVNQIQAGLSVSDLFRGRNTQVQVSPVASEAFDHPSRGERRRLQRTTLTVTAFTQLDEDGKRIRRTLTFPMVYHRSIPDDVNIKIVTVKRERLGNRFRWSVTFTSTRNGLSKVEPIQNGYVCGVNLGWKQVQGELRIATVQCGGQSEHLMLPSELIRSFDYIDNQKASLDLLANRIHNDIMRIENVFQPAPEELLMRYAKLRSLKKPDARRLVGFIGFWKFKHGDYAPDDLIVFSEARRSLRRLLNCIDNLRDKTISHRNEIYKIWAKRLAETYGKIVLDGYDLSDLALVKHSDGSKTPLPLIARRNRQRAAPSELRKWIILQAKKTGSEVQLVEAANTKTCSVCGERSMRGNPSELIWTCEECDNRLDQDVNASTNLSRFGKRAEEGRRSQIAV